ncbi:Retrovirus-related Pol polyprotein from transposon TNT 1-94 [Sesamum angolense]|uniref:Retrovirus-related Pol polyprotein from transposon TNT 1-94 n=1 Tax=Sesamum angolense TaxID=2727404 RepID=A0AAE1WG70_9LAMI|nr:Retrovirus-related Pol polyprotein from transposon TNT 1-94 [Sesamum angolense]
MTNVGVNPNSTSLTHKESDEPRRSKRALVVKDFGSDFVTYNIEDDPIDVKTAFLYGELEEEIYMDQPEGFIAHDDILLIGSCTNIISETKSFLKNKFEMKDIGEADVILGIKLIRSSDGISISQSHYVEKIIDNFGYQNSRIAKTPYDSSIALFKNESGILVAQLRVLRYLNGTVSLVIHYDRFPTVFEGYSDASWIAKNSESNGCSGYIFTLGGGEFSWKFPKQTLITRSTFEAELCALDTIGTEVEWIFRLLSQLSIVSQRLPHIVVHCDSQTTIAKVRSRKYNQMTKRHIQVRLKSIRVLVSDRVIGIDFVGTKDNVADPLTKRLDLSQVYKSRLGMGLRIHQ